MAGGIIRDEYLEDHGGSGGLDPSQRLAGVRRVHLGLVVERVGDHLAVQRFLVFISHLDPEAGRIRSEITSESIREVTPCRSVAGRSPGRGRRRRRRSPATPTSDQLTDSNLKPCPHPVECRPHPPRPRSHLSSRASPTRAGRPSPASTSQPMAVDRSPIDEVQGWQHRRSPAKDSARQRRGRRQHLCRQQRIIGNQVQIAPIWVMSGRWRDPRREQIHRRASRRRMICCAASMSGEIAESRILVRASIALSSAVLAVSPAMIGSSLLLVFALVAVLELMADGVDAPPSSGWRRCPTACATRPAPPAPPPPVPPPPVPAPPVPAPPVPAGAAPFLAPTVLGSTSIAFLANPVASAIVLFNVSAVVSVCTFACASELSHAGQVLRQFVAGIDEISFRRRDQRGSSQRDPG